MLYAAYFLLYLIVFMLGACVASFLFVCAYRTPRGVSFIKGRSHCPACAHTLGATDLVPIISYLSLRGRCRYCQARIPARYALYEAAGGLLSVLCFLHAGPPLYFFYFTVACVLLAVSFFDISTTEIPDILHALLFALGLLCVWLFPDTPLLSRIIGIFAVSAPLLLLTLIVPGAFGGGDIKLIAAAGFLLGWKCVLLAAFIAILLGGAYAIALVARKKAAKGARMVFGPYLCAGIFAALLWGDALIGWYWGLFF